MVRRQTRVSISAPASTRMMARRTGPVMSVPVRTNGPAPPGATTTGPSVGVWVGEMGVLGVRATVADADADAVLSSSSTTVTVTVSVCLSPASP